MSEIPNCPECGSGYTYQSDFFYACSMCGHEWTVQPEAEEEAEEEDVVRDAYGNELRDGDSVTLIKDLKVSGSSSVVKMGTKVKNIRLVEGEHDIDCKIEGIGAMGLKSEFVKKA